jgi:hypothetical protein
MNREAAERFRAALSIDPGFPGAREALERVEAGSKGAYGQGE